MVTTGPRPAPTGSSGTGAPDRDPDPDPNPDTATAAPAGGRVALTRRRTLLAFLVAAGALIAVPLVASRLISQPAGDEHVFEIPAGTADRLAAGDDVDVLPADLRLDLADRLVVINRDDRTHRVGPFTVAPGQRLERRFADALSFSGFCSLHASGNIDIEVRPQS